MTSFLEANNTSLEKVKSTAFQFGKKRKVIPWSDAVLGWRTFLHLGSLVGVLISADDTVEDYLAGVLDEVQVEVLGDFLVEVLVEVLAEVLAGDDFDVK